MMLKKIMGDLDCLLLLVFLSAALVVMLYG